VDGDTGEEDDLEGIGPHAAALGAAETLPRSWQLGVFENNRRMFRGGISTVSNGKLMGHDDMSYKVDFVVRVVIKIGRLLHEMRSMWK
jgi:hypothetical protein